MPNPRILLADSDTSFRTNASGALRAQGYVVIPAENNSEAIALLDKESPDLVLADVALPPRDGLELLHRARAKQPPPPVILLAEPRNVVAATAGVRQGATEFMIKPADDLNRLVVTVERVLSRRDSSGIKAIDTGQAPTFSAPPVAPAVPRTTGTATTLAAGASTPGAGPQWAEPSVGSALLDAAMAGRELNVLLSLASEEIAALVHALRTVILLLQENGQLELMGSQGYLDRTDAARSYVAAGGEEFAWRVVDTGGIQSDQTAPISLQGETPQVYSMLGLPLQYSDRILGAVIAIRAAEEEGTGAGSAALQELLQITSLCIELQKMQGLAAQRNPIDRLTGLLNREHFFEQGDREFRRSWRFGEPIGALELDLDDFTRLQQLLGPDGSDQVMQLVAQAVRPIVRSVDIVGRLDTDRIGIVVLKGTRDNSLRVAERLRRAIAEIELATPEGTWQVTASIGLASYPREQCVSIHDLFAIASQATRAAKRSGRNRVVAI